MTRTLASIAIAAALVLAGALPATGAAMGAQQSEGYAGAHVSFETSNDAVVDYGVGGETVLESVAVNSQSAVESDAGVGVDVGLSAMSDIAGAALSLGARTETSATVTADSGAELTAHDNPRGILVVSAGNGSQYVTANVSSGAEASAESDQRVVVNRDDGRDGAFLVVGNGSVQVNDGGNVSASLSEDAQLVFRSYESEREADDEQQERMIVNGTATAEAYVTQSGEDGSELAADAVEYGNDTRVNVTSYGEGAVNVTAERTQHEGRVIITTVSEQVLDATENLSVRVDGEAAAEASSYGELESAIEEGNESRFLVRQGASADASADVLVAVNHFSERQITMTDDSTNESETTENGTETATADGTEESTEGDDAETTDDESTPEPTPTAGDGPGFGLVAALVAAGLLGLAATRRA
ncbi:hypothetical protein [Halomicrobium salinisoli]|uniref:hypothetical protein n=1 Tax=Halomicrobium salinisoli TaxID=2878391 RepID=UPI001CF0BBC8|nr:hypothetical protein [Halomicrobium salinisoli]